ncbi:hypothetical protein CMUS01_02544 [Colletotrichum musicola]|uniref:Protein kinase domain-containing protein n=1 Tax=Colletotrichum musicola TaxID=2175873 RepID=A0A8H6U7D5_9PEZI|nr:hypothetical protein CMUS01_02544 [Colletotrichum musicola]
MAATTATDPEHPQPAFQFEKKVEGNIWRVRRVAQHSGYADGEEFIARKVDDFDEYYEAGKYSLGFTTARQRQIKGLMDLLYDHNIGRNIAQIFNHENVISLAGYLRQTPFHPKVDATEDYLVWDICDAGTLDLQFADRSSEREPNCFLPESLCWHVVTSVLRALAWLHDGFRQSIDWTTGDAHWTGTDMEWMPVLHRDIGGPSIFFQHPRGVETYGSCKLGKFGNVFVSGVPAQRDEMPVAGGSDTIPDSDAFPLAPRQGYMSLNALRAQWADYKATGDERKRLYTISDDHWALGAALFRMMFGRPLPSLDGCEACRCIHIRRCADMNCVDGTAHYGYGCEHRNFEGCRCPQQCTAQPDFHIDEILSRLGYSKYLKVAARKLLDYDLENPARSTWELCEDIDLLYYAWRKTEDGRAYVDIRDDMRGRFWELNEMTESAD